MSALSPELEAFRARVVAFMDPHVAEFGQAARLGLSLDDDVALARRWQATKAAAGFAGLTFPVEYGGAGLSQIEQVLFVEEEAARGFPSAYFVISLSMPIPMVLRYATPEQKARFVPPALRGEQMWSQLFSEPSTGSDLAAVRTRAVRDGGDWILSGQKVWTTFAQYSDYGVIVARSDPDAPKHRGLTYFFVDLKAPGVTVRPIRQLHGAEEFNEVFFDDVRIPDAWRLGEVGAGFRLAVETLMIERYTAAADETGFGPPLDALVALAQETQLNGRPASQDGRVRSVIARAFATQQALSAIHEKSVLELAAGREPGPEGSIHKLVGARGRREVAICALDLMGADGLRFDAAAHLRPKTDFAMSWMDQPTLRIAGGTDEMLLNTVAERILGLPQDYRPDKASR
ncbi:acyl-CoA dehydrogenase family protein [Caulobacter sp. BK020]|uniref:acyl-CoA dehydrogenase family protein n=1 Tax=Caulobacter sp. BK020 TaxID=2512117 RepID=UPI001047A90F|nr:acyl-CoA dehydrogenase family protein [Caulobacter sp. BK020]TCS08136.1 alkylation response protein AidB-like acyl-CoA dehydrogenase [Caulobacter sp. BK020]